MGRIRRGILRFQHKALGLFPPVKDSQLHVRDAIVASRQAVRELPLQALGKYVWRVCLRDRQGSQEKAQENAHTYQQRSQ